MVNELIEKQKQNASTEPTPYERLRTIVGKHIAIAIQRHATELTAP